MLLSFKCHSFDKIGTNLFFMFTYSILKDSLNSNFTDLPFPTSKPWYAIPTYSELSVVANKTYEWQSLQEFLDG